MHRGRDEIVGVYQRPNPKYMVNVLESNQELTKGVVIVNTGRVPYCFYLDSASAFSATAYTATLYVMV